MPRRTRVLFRQIRLRTSRHARRGNLVARGVCSYAAIERIKQRGKAASSQPAVLRISYGVRLRLPLFLRCPPLSSNRSPECRSPLLCLPSASPAAPLPLRPCALSLGRSLACGPWPINPHLHRDWARPCDICTGTALAPATSAPGLRWDWARPCDICTGTGLCGSGCASRTRPRARRRGCGWSAPSSTRVSSA